MLNMLLVNPELIEMTKSTGQIPFIPRKTDFAIWMHNYDRRLYKRVTDKKRYPKRAEKHHEYEKQRRKTLRIALIYELGTYCNKCGFNADIRALQLDHINGGGLREMRERFTNTNSKMWRYYLNNLNEAKQKLQVLCANCNTIKKYTNNEFYKQGSVS